MYYVVLIAEYYMNNKHVETYVHKLTLNGSYFVSQYVLIQSKFN